MLLDADGAPCGTADKATVHTEDTPLHLAFSSYLFDAEGRLLLTRRALTKRAFPGVWTNSCCGHPAPDEDPFDAVRRRVRTELGLEVTDLRVTLPTFRYRAADASGIVEHELCPVYVGQVAGDPTPDRNEVDDWRWAVWASLDVTELSPWAQLQVEALRALLDLG